MESLKLKELLDNVQEAANQLEDQYDEALLKDLEAVSDWDQWGWAPHDNNWKDENKDSVRHGSLSVKLWVPMSWLSHYRRLRKRNYMVLQRTLSKIFPEALFIFSSEDRYIELIFNNPDKLLAMVQRLNLSKLSHLLLNQAEKLQYDLHAAYIETKSRIKRWIPIWKNFGPPKFDLGQRARVEMKHNGSWYLKDQRLKDTFDCFGGVSGKIVEIDCKPPEACDWGETQQRWYKLEINYGHPTKQCGGTFHARLPEEVLSAVGTPPSK